MPFNSTNEREKALVTRVTVLIKDLLIELTTGGSLFPLPRLRLSCASLRLSVCAVVASADAQDTREAAVADIPPLIQESDVQLMANNRRREAKALCFTRFDDQSTKGKAMKRRESERG